MPARGDHDERHTDQPLGHHGRRQKDRQRPDDADRSAPVEHRLKRAAERLDQEPQGHCGEAIPELLGGLGDRFDGKKDVDHHRKLRLETAAHASCTRFHAVDAGDYRASIREQDGALRRRLGAATPAIEQVDADLAFETCDEIADRRLRPAQLAPGGGEAAFLYGGDEGS